ncbi:MAG TPA: hypothetical protein VNN19_13375 [bacterium]|nr:hypothetical protein [bacterium]
MTVRQGAVVGYRRAALTDGAGRILAYVDRIAVHPAPSGGGAVGLGGIAFAPGAFERLAGGGIRAVVASRGVRRLELRGLRLAFHAGEQRAPGGGWYVEAAVGTARAVVRPPRRRRGRSVRTV